MQELVDIGVTHSPHTCLPCRHGKRRCDRVYPNCTLCSEWVTCSYGPIACQEQIITESDHTRRQSECVYPYRRKERERRGAGANTDVSLPISTATASHFSVNAPKDRTETGYHGLSDSSVSDLLAARFLDPDIFYQMRLEIPKVDMAVTKAVATLVGSIFDIQTAANVFFNTVHTWMPIISKKLFSLNLLNRLSHRRAELFLLTLSMKLCSCRVKTPRTALYRVTKQLYVDMESSGILSIQVLQAAVLITLYELGHAIYPAALLSAGHCARYAVALGIDKTATSHNTVKLPWIEEEENRRVWWSIVILDRFVLRCTSSHHTFLRSRAFCSPTLNNC